MISSSAAPSEVAESVLPLPPQLRGFLWAIGTTAGAGLLLFSVAQAARPRTVGDGVTGSPPPPRGRMATASAPPTGKRRSSVALDRNPEDIAARLELARVRLDQQDYMAVWAETQHVLQRSAGNPRALTYQSQVRLAMGQPDVALAMLKEALAKDPGLFPAYVYVSYVHLRMGQTKDAKAVLAEAKRRFPADAVPVRRAVRGDAGGGRAARPDAPWRHGQPPRGVARAKGPTPTPG